MAQFHVDAGKKGYQVSKDKLNLRFIIAREEYNKHPKLCKNCNIPIPYDSKRLDYCNQKCYFEYVKKHKLFKKEKKIKVCIECGNPINYSKFCSKKCQRIYTFKYKRDNGMPIGKAAIRGYLLLTREHKCEECKLKIWNDKPITLESHHKNGNHKDNSEENLMLICPNCHSQTENYKAKNKGHGRDKRRLK